MSHGRSVALKGQGVGHGDMKRSLGRFRRIVRRRGSRFSGGPTAHDDHKSVGLRHDGARNFKKLDRAARLPNGLHERVEARVLGIKRRTEKRALVGAVLNALLRFSAATTVALTTATVVTTATTVVTTTTATVVTTAAGIAARAATAGILAALGRATTWGGRSAGRSFTRTTGTGRFAKGAAIAVHGRATTRPIAPVVTTRAVSARIAFATVRGGRFFLRPLRAETEPLKLVQIEFVEIRGRIFFGGVVVHGVRKSRRSGTCVSS